MRPEPRPEPPPDLAPTAPPDSASASAPNAPPASASPPDRTSTPIIPSTIRAAFTSPIPGHNFKNRIHAISSNGLINTRNADTTSRTCADFINDVPPSFRYGIFFCKQAPSTFASAHADRPSTIESASRAPSSTVLNTSSVISSASSHSLNVCTSSGRIPSPRNAFNSLL